MTSRERFLAAMRNDIPDRVPVAPDISTYMPISDLMLNGTPETVRQKAIEAMKDAGYGGGFILSTGDQCGR